ncbi:hypothetical protein T11_14982 [Trichinella zimbabwensis]|uniref:Uncharacterized protein n=1 Tax=Trichinella zimbabwensis TaxID=268475 RepID=A0A0V1HLD2_9BILA|nr:hypothetical protein T11_14982 [Trichinella zimbabwensis]
MQVSFKCYGERMFNESAPPLLAEQPLMLREHGQHAQARFSSMLDHVTYGLPWLTDQTEFQGTDEQVLRKDFSTPPTPKGESNCHASLDGSTRRSDLADRVTVPCSVFTVTDLTTPSSLG